ncbi:MAG: formate acetyltransferase [archaeon]|nr:formate acetyltransferase [archaeon]
MADIQMLPFKLGLKGLGLMTRFSKSLKEEIVSLDNKSIQITTRLGEPNLWVKFENRKFLAGSGKIDNPDVKLIYRNSKLMAKALSTSPEENMDMLLKGDLYYIGNLALLAKFSYITTLVPIKSNKPDSLGFPLKTKITDEFSEIKKCNYAILNRKVDNVNYLNDPYLGKYSLQDFPILHKYKDKWFSEDVWICSERGKNVTDFHTENGFETDKNGNPWFPSERQGFALKHIMETKKAIIWEDDLIPGTTTSKRLGVQMYPEMGGTALWAELRETHARKLNPYRITQEEIDIFNKFVFPYWIDRNIREHARKKYGNPVSQQLEELWVFYFCWKTQAVSHSIPDFTRVLKKGFMKLIEEIKEQSAKTNENEVDKKKFYNGMIATLEGVITYAQNLRIECQRQLTGLENESSNNIKRIENLKKMISSLERVPANPAESFMDAITSVWIIWLTCHQESMNAGLSLGRLDQVLYPYFEMDMKAVNSDEEKKQKIEEIIELVGAFYMKCQDHVPSVPEIGNKLFGGSSSDQALTLGGVTPEGENAVNDLTYIFLKVTEMLCLRDPNVNSRYYEGINSKEYLQRLCEVNINTTSTPSIHNDKEMVNILENHGFETEDARNWGATGCVEPTSLGKHYGHTNCLMFNLVAPLEILINNGKHPQVHPEVGLKTGEFNSEVFPTYESVLKGYKEQLSYMIDQSVEYNNNLGITHQEVHPTPYLSSMYDGPLEKGKDLINGGAIYNTSGVACVSLSDVIDSLSVLKKIVYEDKFVTLEDLKIAMDRDFMDPKDKILQEKIKRVPKFGSDDLITNKIAEDLVDYIYDEFRKVKNYRDGEYLTGFWSMSYHTAFGILSGTLPSGRLSRKAFTPGITPAPGSSDQLIENIKSVAKINNQKTPNNIAFNVKLVPSPNDTHEESLENFSGYVKSYFDLGGLQWQFNVVTSDMLREAMNHPEQYRWLMVRISGYNAYFTSLNKDMQIELIERMEFTS